PVPRVEHKITTGSCHRFSEAVVVELGEASVEHCTSCVRLLYDSDEWITETVAGQNFTLGNQGVGVTTCGDVVHRHRLRRCLVECHIPAELARSVFTTFENRRFVYRQLGCGVTRACMQERPRGISFASDTHVDYTTTRRVVLKVHPTFTHHRFPGRSDKRSVLVHIQLIRHFPHLIADAYPARFSPK